MIKISATRGVFTQPSSHDGDGDLIERICAAYRHSCSVFGRSDAVGDSQWTLLNRWKSSIHEALFSGDGAQELLRDPSSNNLFLGFDTIVATHAEKLRASSNVQDTQTAIIIRAVELLAESIGVSRVPITEGPHLLTHKDTSMDAALSLIEERIGIKLVFPNPYRDEFGVETSRGIVSLRPVFAIYQAYQLAQLMPMSTRKAILEIGAGLGRTAMYCYYMGMKHYSIIDLPLANAAQAYFLGRTIGPKNIVLAGENSSGSVHILPPSSLESVKAGIVLNADSLTEMDRGVADQYVAFARDHSDIFVSINRETNPFTAHDVIRTAMPDSIMMRYPHSMRGGYMEEVVFLSYRQS